MSQQDKDNPATAKETTPRIEIGELSVNQDNPQGLTDDEAKKIQGGKVSMNDFHYVMRTGNESGG